MTIAGRVCNMQVERKRSAVSCTMSGCRGVCMSFIDNTPRRSCYGSSRTVLGRTTCMMQHSIVGKAPSIPRAQRSLLSSRQRRFQSPTGTSRRLLQVFQPLHNSPQWAAVPSRPHTPFRRATLNWQLGRKGNRSPTSTGADYSNSSTMVNTESKASWLSSTMIGSLVNHTSSFQSGAHPI